MGTRLVLGGKGKAHLTETERDAPAFLEVKNCGICHSDRKVFYSPPSAMQFPRVPGHEVSGILAIDLPRQKLYTGDRVVLWPALVCGTCKFCRTKRQNLCPQIELFGYHLDGGFASRISLPLEQLDKVLLYKIPETLTFTQATFAEPLACVLNGLQKFSREQPDSVLILGAGLMGRLCSRTARFFWPGADIFLYDIHPERVSNAEKEGGTSSLRHADLVFIASSGGDTFEAGLTCLNAGGTLVLFSGFAAHEKQKTVDHNSLHKNEQVLAGAYGCLPGHIDQALTLLSNRAVMVDDLISRIISPDAVPDELERSLSSANYKTIIRL